MPLCMSTVPVTTVKGESMPVRCEVELDIFSGVPNPAWSLAEAEVAGFTGQLAALPRTAPRTLSGKLGYRGFIVQCTEGGDAWSVHLQNGVVRIARGATVYADDEQRRLERWLLDTGRPHLKPDLLEMVEKELR
jgi:hypothetical protein